uniref:ATP synthase complex subunit 8 n=1 Tax=Scirtidae sp. GENSP01 TaxID=1205580 RepID=A0A0S2MQ72_9COLE|nr:ATP synthase F0 subunit 8 [Scirtidae sp. GENSP01]
MPQMAPMNWFYLFIMFLSTFIMFNSFNYFLFMKMKSKMMNFKMNKNSMNWKW